MQASILKTFIKLLTTNSFIDILELFVQSACDLSERGLKVLEIIENKIKSKHFSCNFACNFSTEKPFFAFRHFAKLNIIY